MKSKPKIVMTSMTGWDFNYLKRIIESVELKNPVITTGRNLFTGSFKLIVSWEVDNGK